jgi:dTDP-4-dehydrorhamnose reductase
MRVLILGGAGMLGHKMWQALSARYAETYVTLRKPREVYARYGLFDSDRVRDRIDAGDFTAVERCLNEIGPDVIVNCVGMTYRHPSARSQLASIALNALFPHQLAQWAEAKARVIHFSTDCVFDGRVGGYTEASPVSSDDVYGRTKSLGEITGPGCLTLRSSMIGRELERGTELVEWLIAQDHKTIKGYRNATFTGLSTLLWTRVVVDVIERHPELSGLFHVTTDPISKYELLRLLAAAYQLEIQIDPDDEVVCHRNLDGSKFAALTGFRAPPWSAIVAEMAADPTPYSRWRELT